MPRTLREQSRLALAIRRAKVTALKGKRLAEWALAPSAFPKAPIASQEERVCLHEICVDAAGVQSHPQLEEGKLRNLRLAAAHFDGRLITQDLPFSFWRLLGEPTKRRGFLPGTEVRDGCIVPTIGGGLCMLSGALFRLAAELDCEILERHGHTVSVGEDARIDATVFWPFVDLRFSPKRGELLLRVSLRDNQLRVGAYGVPSAPIVRLPVWREETSRVGDVRSSRIVRGSSSSASEELGVDKQRIAKTGLRRNCLTCEEHQCEAREALVGAL